MRRATLPKPRRTQLTLGNYCSASNEGSETSKKKSRLFFFEMDKSDWPPHWFRFFEELEPDKYKESVNKVVEHQFFEETHIKTNILLALSIMLVLTLVLIKMTKLHEFAKPTCQNTTLFKIIQNNV